jgi:septal ring factor EnvC (AmiA/AmiB activator)
MRFTIRELIWITLVVAFAACRCADRRDAHRQRLKDKSQISEQAKLIKQNEAQVVSVQKMLLSARADERAIREQLADFVATQEDKLRIDVSPGLFTRLTSQEQP